MGAAVASFAKKHWKGILAIVLILVMLLVSVVQSVVSSIIALLGAEEEENSNSGSYSVTKLYVKATIDDELLEGLEVTLTPQDEDNTTVLNFPKTDKNGLASITLSSGSSNLGSFNGASTGDVLQGSVTFYCDSGTTACGTPVGMGTCAVDPYIIHYGSVLYIAEIDSDGNETGKVYGYAEATDTGGFTNGLEKSPPYKPLPKGSYESRVDNIQGVNYKRLVDVWYPSESEGRNQWGTRACNIYIVESTPLEGHSQAAKNQATGHKIEKYIGKPTSEGTTGSINTFSGSSLSDNYSIDYNGKYTCAENGTLNMKSVQQGNHETIVLMASDNTNIRLEFWIVTETSGSGISQDATKDAVIVTTDCQPINNTSSAIYKGATNLKDCYKTKDAGGINPCNYNPQPQCVMYVWGRTYELWNGFSLPTGKGAAQNYWYNMNDSRVQKISASSTPSVGDIAVFGSSSSSSAGHIAVVEAVEGNTIYISDSGQTFKDAWNQGRSHTASFEVGGKLYGGQVLGYLRPNV